MMFKRSAFILFFLAAASIGWAGQAIKFPSVYEENGIQLPLRASVLKRVLFVRAIAAGIYFAEGDGTSNDDFLKDVPKRIEAVFFMHISHKDFAGYARGKIWDNVSRKEFAKLEDRLKTMADYLVEIKPGDKYNLTYIPGSGTRFEYNGKLMGTIEGEDFARAIFSVWVGRSPMDKILRHQILDKFRESIKKDKAKTR
jgi:hypothetical protein